MRQVMKSKTGKIYSQLAGSLYLLIAVIGGVSIGYIPGEIIVAGDAFIRFVQIDYMYVSLTFSSLLVLAVIAEFWFAFWLLIKGVSMDLINKLN